MFGSDWLRTERLDGFVMQALANATGTLLAAAVIFLASLIAGVLDDVPLESVIGAVGIVLIAVLLVAAATRAEQKARQAADASRDALADATGALSEVEFAPQLTDEQIEALGDLGGRVRWGGPIRLSDDQIAALRKAAGTMGGAISLNDETLAKLKSMSGGKPPFELSPEQQKALRTLASNSLTVKQRAMFAELSEQIRRQFPPRMGE